MDSSLPILSLSAVAVAGAAATFPKIKARLELSRAKHRSLTGHSKMSRRVARLLPFYEFSGDQYFNADGAPAEIAGQRKDAFFALAKLYAERYAKGRQMTAEAVTHISDLQFTRAYRVPFQFSSLVQKNLGTSAFMESSSGVTVTDVDGNLFYDLTGSYGVNIFGNDFYKECIADGEKRAEKLGPVLGSYHPVVADNVKRICEISGRTKFPSTCPAPRPSCRRCGWRATTPSARIWFALPAPITAGGATCSRASAIRSPPTRPTRSPKCPSRRCTCCGRGATSPACWSTRCRRCIRTPMRPATPRWSIPRATAHFDREAYTAWLKQLREVCDQRGIVLIFDEVFLGFRIAAGGAQEYFGVRADMVTYGKSLAGGLPIGVVCGKKELMRRFRDDRPADVCFARGTFNSHPYVMTAMDEFLSRLSSPNFRSVYNGLDETWNGRAERLNARFEKEELPVRVANFSSVWTVQYTEPSRYNWMLQYYLRAEGLSLSWVGTGRLIFSLNFTDADFAEVESRFVAAAQKMKRDGWWWHSPDLTNKAIRRQILKEMLASKFRR